MKLFRPIWSPIQPTTILRELCLTSVVVYYTRAACAKSHIFAAVFNFDQLFWRQHVIVNVRKLPTIADFLAVCVKRLFHVVASTECFDVIMVSGNPIQAPLRDGGYLTRYKEKT